MKQFKGKNCYIWCLRDHLMFILYLLFENIVSSLIIVYPNNIISSPFLYLSHLLTRTTSVFIIYGLDFCQLPMSPVCKAPNTQYVGTEIKSIENVEDYDSCAVLCLWRSDCTAQSYHEVWFINQFQIFRETINSFQRTIS